VTFIWPGAAKKKDVYKSRKSSIPVEIVRTMHGKGMVVATVNFLSVTVSSSLRADAWDRTVQIGEFPRHRPEYHQKRVVRSVSHCGESSTRIVSIDLSRLVSTSTPIATNRAPSPALALLPANTNR
jgi:hypothetical protein